MKNYIYTGAFIDAKILNGAISFLGKSRLAKLIEFPHVTFQFKPETVAESLFGEKIYIKVLGYGNDGKNEGLRVEAFATNQLLADMINEISVPHITVSVSADGKPVDTAKLSFSPIPSFFMEATYGAYTPEGVILEKR